MGVSGQMQVTLRSPHPTEATVATWTLPAHVVTEKTALSTVASDGSDDSVVYIQPRIADALHIKDGENIDIVFHGIMRDSVTVQVKYRARMTCDVLIQDMAGLGSIPAASPSSSDMPSSTFTLPPPQNMWTTDQTITKERRGGARLYFDGISRDSPTGPCGYGFHIVKGTYSARGEDLVQGYGYAGMDKSSNEMEYHGLLEGLYWASRLDLRHLSVFGVSETIIKQLTGEYTIKNRRLKALYDKCQGILERNAGMKCKYQRIHREENDIAESLSNLGIARKETVVSCHWPNVNHLMARETPSTG